MHLEEQAESYLLYLTVLLEDNQYYSEVLLEPKKLLLTITYTLHFLILKHFPQHIELSKLLCKCKASTIFKP